MGSFWLEQTHQEISNRADYLNVINLVDRSEPPPVQMSFRQ